MGPSAHLPVPTNWAPQVHVGDQLLGTGSHVGDRGAAARVEMVPRGMGRLEEGCMDQAGCTERPLEETGQVGAASENPADRRGAGIGPQSTGHWTWTPCRLCKVRRLG